MQHYPLLPTALPAKRYAYENTALSPVSPFLPEYDVKRRKLEDGSPHRTIAQSLERKLDHDSSSVRTSPPSSVASILNTNLPLPLFPSLFHHAVTAHHAASRHLQQVFIPPNVSCAPEHNSTPIQWCADHGNSTYHPDPVALLKTIGLLLHSLDLLRLGISSKNLSDKERVFFGLEFAIVAIKLIRAAKASEMALNGAFDVTRVWSDARDAIGNGIFLARRTTYLRPISHRLEALDARLLFMQNKGNAARRATRQSLNETPDHEYAHRYTLMLLNLEYAEHGPTDSFAFVNELQEQAEKLDHPQMIHLSMLIRLRLLFAHRRWSEIPSVLNQLASVLTATEAGFLSSVNQGLEMWDAHLRLHHTLYTALWEGRIGNDLSAKESMKKVYLLMDSVAEHGTLRPLAMSAGQLAFKFPTLPGSGPQELLVQLTPPNITYLMTYLVSVTCRRDFLGSAASCKSLVLSAMMRESEDTARRDDMWDVDFPASHGIAEAINLRREIAMIRVEVMLEEATALMFRSSSQEADKILQKAVHLVQDYDLLSDFAPHLCLAHAQLAHLLGRDKTASQLYDAASALLKPGSELSLSVQLNASAVRGHFTATNTNRLRKESLLSLAHKCCSSTNAGLAAAGQFVGSLLEVNRMSSKKKLSSAYEISQRANNNVLRCLIFAFTTSTHLYGSSDKCFRQLETGRELAKLLGGRDREDGVGQVTLGLWFAVKLKEHNRRDGHVEAYVEAKKSVQFHLDRLEEQKGEVRRLVHEFI